MISRKLFSRSPQRGISHYTIAWAIVLVFFGVLVVTQYISLRSSIRRVSCSHAKKNTQKAFEIYCESTSGFIPPPFKPIDVVLLFESRVLHNIPICGGNGTYKVDDNGMIYCSFHDRNVEQ